MLTQKVINRMRSYKNRVFNWGRTCGSAAVTLLVCTKKGQWRKVALSGRPSWDERNEIIAGFIPAGSSVLDVGCGAQTLKQHLKPGCRYQPCDLIKSSPDVILCDFNSGSYPDFKERYDYVVCSGVLEYIWNPQNFLLKIPAVGNLVILTYNPLAPGDSKLARLGNGYGWVNHFTRPELENLFSELGLQWTALCIDEKRLGYIMYLLELKNHSRGENTEIQETET